MSDQPQRGFPPRAAPSGWSRTEHLFSNPVPGPLKHVLGVNKRGENSGFRVFA
jgi:hypothetical protein